MTTVKKGVLVSSKEWAKHLRPYGRRQFWGQHRKAEQQIAQATARLAERQEPLGEPFASILYDNLWDLYITDEAS